MNQIIRTLPDSGSPGEGTLTEQRAIAIARGLFEAGRHTGKIEDMAEQRQAVDAVLFAVTRMEWPQSAVEREFYGDEVWAYILNLFAETLSPSDQNLLAADTTLLVSDEVLACKFAHYIAGVPCERFGFGQIVDAISIRERPPEVEDRAIPGHWEGDLLSGSKNSYIATLVERHSRFALLIKVPSKDTAVVVAALSRHVRKLPASLRRSLTWDRGLEMAKHKDFTVATNVKVYFCDPQSPWQRGTNENTNGLLRQYFPRRTDLSGYTQAHLNKVALRLNQRPRKTLGFQTPASKLQESVASTV